MSIAKVIKHLKKEYDKAQKVDFIRKPLSFALYQTWRWCDRIEEEQNK